MLFSLVCDCEVVLPLELQLPSLHTILAFDMITKDNHKLHLQELETLDEKKLQAQQHIEFYQVKISHAFNKKVKEWVFTLSDLILIVKCPMIVTHKSRGKFQPK